MQQLGVFGGSFDPPHVAHVLAAAYALAIGRIDRLLIVPVFGHPFNKRLAPFEHRVKLCELAFGSLRNVEISRIEQGLPTPNRTLSTLQALTEQWPGARLRLIIGSDVLADAAKWHAFDEVCALAPPLVIGRGGHEHARATGVSLPQVSSTLVRELLFAGAGGTADERLLELLPAAVYDYIVSSSLYAGPGGAP